MFLEFFFALRRKGVAVTPTEWLALMQALDQGLAGADLLRFYHLARSVCVKSETLYDAYDQAWLEVFEAPRPWGRGGGVGGEDLITPDAVRDDLLAWLEGAGPLRTLTDEERAWMEQMDVDALRKLYEERLAEQTERHDGGSHWIGTRGASPFGQGAYHPGGIRVGDRGGGGMAAIVAARRAFQGYRSDVVLDTRQIGVALRKLRRFARDRARMEIDIDATIQATAREGGEITVVERPARVPDVKLLLVMDAGGSMFPHAANVSRLFSAARKASHLKGFKAFYFHNCVYQVLFRDLGRWEGDPVEDVLRTLDPSWKLLLVGDACMAPSELVDRYGANDWNTRNIEPGLYWLERLRRHFRHCAWLNPMHPARWRHPTVRRIAQVFPMFPLSIDGLETALKVLSGLKVKGQEIEVGDDGGW